MQHISSSTAPHRARRGPAVRAAAVLAAASITLAACGQAANDNGNDNAAAGGGGEDQVELRYSWWGSDTRHQMNQELIDAFMAEHPNITITPDFTDWGGYWDKLATQTAAGDTPDVMMQEERYLREYAERGVLADLSELAEISTAEIDPTTLAGGEFDGGLYGIPTGVNVFAMVADPEVFAQAGVPVPDDETWTWEEYVDLAAEISAGTPDGVYGVQDNTFNEVGFSVFARQHGQALYDADGSLGFDEDVLAQWWEMSLELQESGGQPGAAETTEIEAAGPERSLLGTNRGAMMLAWSNQLGAISSAAGRDLELLRFPGESGSERPGMFFKPAMHLSLAAESEHPEEAALFIDYMLNSEEAGQILLSDRGLPANLEVREAISDQLPEVEQQAAAFIDEVGEDIVDSPPVPPIGAGEVAGIVMRLNAEVLFERLTPLEAAQQFIAEAEAATQD